MKNKGIIAAVFVSAIAFASCNKFIDFNHHHGNSDAVNVTDDTFMVKASISNVAEVRAGQLAANKSSDSSIRAFGQMMVTDHSKAQADLKQTASNINRNIADTLDAEHKALEAQLMSLTGRAFDSVYIHSQVKGHEKATALFENEITGGNNWQVKKYANDKLPTIKDHLMEATTIANNY